jgi:metal-sulfur cluster biosynthetic enzyme
MPQSNGQIGESMATNPERLADPLPNESAKLDLACLYRQISDVLDTVMDPCATSAGVPLSIADMGFVRHVEVSKEGDVAVELRLTTPGCIEGALKFSTEIETGVGALSGIRHVDVSYSDVADWSEQDISPTGRRRLEELRQKRRVAMGISIQPRPS